MLLRLRKKVRTRSMTVFDASADLLRILSSISLLIGSSAASLIAFLCFRRASCTST